jgi:cytochrome c-type biogenesis protein CcmH
MSRAPASHARCGGPRPRGRLRRGASLALALGVLSLPPAALAAAPRTTLPAIERQVMCVTCKIPLNVAESKQADDERAYIQELIHRGYDEAQVKHALVGQYGSSVLGLPGTHGFDLTAYLVPVAVVLALLGALAVLIPRWRAQARAQGSSQDAPRSLSSSERERLERDMARFE